MAMLVREFSRVEAVRKLRASSVLALLWFVSRMSQPRWSSSGLTAGEQLALRGIELLHIYDD